ncbi:hypothetical protein RB619_20070 [Flavobacterium sp. LHD-80]|nr:hypothetical protein [Flavobacterium sp. LHD-80]MDQ6472943.1 hypothetical protein [Flavobacterium sp. LHD-80]
MNKINILKILIVALTGVLALMNFSKNDFRKEAQIMHSEISINSIKII